MCLRLVFLLITRASWLPLSRREDARQTAEILILRLWGARTRSGLNPGMKVTMTTAAA
jgi:hypothetical protein